MSTVHRSIRPRRTDVAMALVLAALILLPASAFAQSRRGGGNGGARAVPRGSVRMAPPRAIVPNRGIYNRGARVYGPRTNFGFFYGAPGFYGAYRYGSPWWGGGFYGRSWGPWGYNGIGGYGYPAYGAFGNGWGMPYGYGYSGYSGNPYGGVRIDLPQRQAEVFVDGYFVGTVDNFDGVRQQANLEAGPHRIEVRDPDHQSLSFDVNVQPGRTVTYRGSMRPLYQP
mgnify:CR=1 FL=1